MKPDKISQRLWSGVYTDGYRIGQYYQSWHQPDEVVDSYLPQYDNNELVDRWVEGFYDGYEVNDDQ